MGNIEHWTIWICSECGARAEWTGYRKSSPSRSSCARCGSTERERIEVVRADNGTGAVERIAELEGTVEHLTGELKRCAEEGGTMYARGVAVGRTIGGQ